MGNVESFYKCYSYKMYKFLKASGLEAISSDVNERTGNRFWVFEENEQLSKLLTDYSNYYYKK